MLSLFPRFAILTLFVFAMIPAHAQDRARGETLYKANNCIQCHGTNGQGVASEKGPRIGGQYDWYILTSLNNFKSRERVNPEMYPYIQNLSETDYRDLAAYVSSLSGLEN
jgi:cytochrome c553